MRICARLVLLLLVVSVPPLLHGESIRGSISGMADLSDRQLPAEEFSLYLGELLAISTGDREDFLESVELAIQIPRAIRSSPGGYVLYIYGMAKPTPAEGVISYTGLELANLILPGRSRQYIHIPIDSAPPTTRSKLSGMDTVVLEDSVPPDEFPLLVAFYSISKGGFGGSDKSPLTLKLSPVWKELGALEIVVPGDVVDVSKLAISVDGVRTEWQEKILLTTGTRLLEIETNGYKPITARVSIQPASTTRFSLEMVPGSTSVSFIVPKGVALFLDGEELDANTVAPIPLDPGLHTVTAMLGDYSISRKFDLKQGESLEVSLLLDFVIKPEDE